MTQNIDKQNKVVVRHLETTERAASPIQDFSISTTQPATLQATSAPSLSPLPTSVFAKLKKSKEASAAASTFINPAPHAIIDQRSIHVTQRLQHPLTDPCANFFAGFGTIFNQGLRAFCAMDESQFFQHFHFDSALAHTLFPISGSAEHAIAGVTKATQRAFGRYHELRLGQREAVKKAMHAFGLREIDGRFGLISPNAPGFAHIATPLWLMSYPDSKEAKEQRQLLMQIVMSLYLLKSEALASKICTAVEPLLRAARLDNVANKFAWMKEKCERALAKRAEQIAAQRQAIAVKDHFFAQFLPPPLLPKKPFLPKSFLPQRVTPPSPQLAPPPPAKFVSSFSLTLGKKTDLLDPLEKILTSTSSPETPSALSTPELQARKLANEQKFNRLIADAEKPSARKEKQRRASLDFSRKAVDTSSFPKPATKAARVSAILSPPAAQDKIRLFEESLLLKAGVSEAALATKLAEVQANDLGIKMLSWPVTGKGNYTQFYCNNVLIGEFEPSARFTKRTAILGDKKSASALKHVTIRNDTSLYLRQRHATQASFRDKEHEKTIVKRRNELFSRISPELNATSLNYVINDSRDVVTKNAKEQLRHYLDKHDAADSTHTRVIDLSSFYDAAKDLKTLHAYGIHHLDLKPENLTFDGQRVHIIDTDSMTLMPKFEDMQNPKELKLLRAIGHPEFTASYLPQKFHLELEIIYSANTSEQKLFELEKLRGAADTFCFILSMIEAMNNELFNNEITDEALDFYTKHQAKETTDTQEFKRELYYHRGDGLRTEKVMQLVVEKGQDKLCLEEKAEIEIATNWVNENIKPAFRAQTLEFLKDPYSYAKSIKPPLSLFDIIDWQRPEPH